MTERLHHAALMALLKSPGGITDAYDGLVPTENPPPRWAKVYPPAGWREQTRFSGRRLGRRMTWTIHSVGIDVESAMWVQERVSLKLDDALLTVEGWNPRRLEHVVSRPVLLDESGPHVLHYAVDQFDLLTEPVI